jgi:glyoxylase-like metal-dependent hydrolase (beta-lactamase superfamily II)
MAIAYRHESSVEYAVARQLSPLIRRLVAHNPSPFTYHGTCTYVIGRGNVAVLDPGPLLPEHVDALLAALPGERITHQLVTHTHMDHSPAAKLVTERTGAATYGFGPHGEGRYDRGEKVEAGGDMSFVPAVKVAHGQVIEGDGWSVECVHTPGHCSNHVCFQLREERALFTGDHVMGWSTSVISPPDGDMGDYLASLELLLEREDRLYLPAHGPAIEQPKPFVRSFIEHRREREAQIVECLSQGIERIPEMVPPMYTGLPVILHRAAARSVFAHVLHMLERGIVECLDEQPALDARYRLRR